MTRSFFLFLLITTSISCKTTFAQLTDKQIDTAAISSITDFREMLSIPNDANDVDDIKKNISWCNAELEKRGFSTEEWETPTRPQLFASKMQSSDSVSYTHLTLPTIYSV